MAEARQWSPAAYGEITLIGQDTTCYGEDLGLEDGLAALLENWRRSKAFAGCASFMPIRTGITGRLLETIAKHDNICKYLDLPLQHASGRRC